MGIRFFCPKGHKLNVKDFLAGKRAICPYCGLKVLVPTESTRASSKRQKGDGQSQPPTQETYPLAAPDAAAPRSTSRDDAAVGSSSSIIISAAGNAPPSGSAEVNEFSDSVSDLLTQISGTQPTTNAPSANADNVLADADDVLVGAETPLAEADDPLSEANNVVWYVRPASGGQLGPATNEILRHWLAKGRVKADSFVWREGWRDWQLAGNVFPQFAPGLSKPNLHDLLSEEPASPASSEADLEQLLRSRPRTMQTVTKAILAILILALVVVFVAVVISSLSNS
jgi:DNA-directed RNA polymerase subunit RPC12/RpoP